MYDTTYDISLRFWHPRQSPDQITGALKIDPDRCWNKGASRTTPQGMALAGHHKESYWVAELFKGASVDLSLAKAINKQLDRFESVKEFFQAFVEDRGRIEFFIGWYFEKNGGEEFDYRLMRRLADFCINISLDIYPTTDHTHP